MAFFLYLTSIPLGGGSVQFIGLQVSVYILMNMLAFLCFLFYFLRDSRSHFLFINKLALPIIVSYIVLFALTLITSYLSFDFRAVISHALVIFVFLFFFALISKLSPVFIYRAFFVGGLIIAVVDMFAYWGFVSRTPHSDPLGFGYAGIGFFMTFSNHGAGVSMGLSAALLLSIDSSSFFSKLFYICAAVLMVFVVFISQSRSSYLAVFSVFFILFVFYPLGFIFKSTKLKLLMLICSILIIVPIGYFILHQLFLIREHTVDSRLEGYYQAYDLIINNPWGVGFGQWHNLVFTGSSLHNLFLNYGVSLGIPGLFVSIFLVLYAAFLFLRAYFSYRLRSKWLYGGLAVFSAGMIEGMLAPMTVSDWLNYGLVLLVATSVIPPQKIKVNQLLCKGHP